MHAPGPPLSVELGLDRLDGLVDQGRLVPLVHALGDDLAGGGHGDLGRAVADFADRGGLGLGDLVLGARIAQWSSRMELGADRRCGARPGLQVAARLVGGLARLRAGLARRCGRPGACTSRLLRS